VLGRVAERSSNLHVSKIGRRDSWRKFKSPLIQGGRFAKASLLFNRLSAGEIVCYRWGLLEDGDKLVILELFL